MDKFHVDFDLFKENDSNNEFTIIINSIPLKIWKRLIMIRHWRSWVHCIHPLRSILELRIWLKGIRCKGGSLVHLPSNLFRLFYFFNYFFTFLWFFYADFCVCCFLFLTLHFIITLTFFNLGFFFIFFLLSHLAQFLLCTDLLNSISCFKDFMSENLGMGGTDLPKAIKVQLANEAS